MVRSEGESLAPDRGPTADRRIVALRCLAVLSASAAIIHFAVSGEHFHMYWVFGTFMLVVAWLQSAWAIAAVVRPIRLLEWCGVVLNTGVVSVYLVTRTIGDVIGPTPHEIEPAGFGDVFCTALEAGIVVTCIGLLATKGRGRLRRESLLLAPAVTGVLMAVMVSVSLVAGGSEMVAADPAPSDSTMQMSGSQTSSIHLATTSPAGEITMPDHDMQMPTGMKMASSTACVTTPSVAQQQAAVSLVNSSWANASKYQSLNAAKAAGYRPITPTGKAVVHYLNPSYYQDTVRGGPILDVTQPQSLVYANTSKGAVLVAAMYITTPSGPTPQPGGCLTQWHIHTDLCLTKTSGVVGATGSGCPTGSRNRATPPMMHIWFVPIPGGPTAVDASDAQIVHAAEQVASPLNGTA